MNKDIWKYIANCTLCCREKAKVQSYALHMTEIPDRPFDKATIDMVTESETSTSGNRHILTIIDHLTGWPEAFPAPDMSTDHRYRYTDSIDLYQLLPSSTHVP